jgi:hypothetical protein
VLQLALVVTPQETNVAQAAEQSDWSFAPPAPPLLVEAPPFPLAPATLEPPSPPAAEMPPAPPVAPPSEVPILPPLEHAEISNAPTITARIILVL